MKAKGYDQSRVDSFHFPQQIGAACIDFGSGGSAAFWKETFYEIGDIYLFTIESGYGQQMIQMGAEGPVNILPDWSSTGPGACAIMKIFAWIFPSPGRACFLVRCSGQKVQFRISFLNASQSMNS